MENIQIYSEKAGGLFLIEEHTIGGLRDESDLINAQHHALVTIEFTLDIMKNIEGTIEEKIDFLLKTKEEIPKFNVKP